MICFRFIFGRFSISRVVRNLYLPTWFSTYEIRNLFIMRLLKGTDMNQEFSSMKSFWWERMNLEILKIWKWKCEGIVNNKRWADIEWKLNQFQSEYFEIFNFFQLIFNPHSRSSAARRHSGNLLGWQRLVPNLHTVYQCLHRRSRPAPPEQQWQTVWVQMENIEMSNNYKIWWWWYKII